MTGDVCIFTDSQLTCNQILGRWKVKAEHLRPMVAACRRKLEEASAQIAWVPREQNHAGRYMERRLNPTGPAAAAAPAPAPLAAPAPARAPDRPGEGGQG